LLLEFPEDPSLSTAATPPHAVQNLPEYQSFSDKRISSLDYVDELNKAAFHWRTDQALTEWQWLTAEA
jgi:hypothetical protein